MDSPARHLHIACVGTYPPRPCGIATFTRDLCDAINVDAGDDRACHIIAINHQKEGYAYSNDVRFEIRQQQAADYRRAADFANVHHYDVLLVEHEYGIFGGDHGEHLLGLLRNVRMPVVATLHTVLPEPDTRMRQVTESVLQCCDRVSVMSQRAAEILETVYDACPDKVCVIPHGIPDLAFVDAGFYKDQFGVEGKTMMLTFGLLSPGKGIEYVIKALPPLVRDHPELVYVIIGATHPNILRQSGESYRHSLQHLAEDLGVLAHIVFDDRYVDLDELCKFLMAADIYVTPSLGEHQIASGTLAYAMGAGKPIIATPYTYAKEMLAEGRGSLVPFRDSEAITCEVEKWLVDPAERLAVGKAAYLHSRDAVWSSVAASYRKVFEEAIHEPCNATQRSSRLVQSSTSPLHAVPEVDLSAFKTMTDDVGIIQHAWYTTPDRNHGYCIDDNARALVVALQAVELTADVVLHGFARRYLSFIHHAYNPDVGRFRNFLSYDRRWLEEEGSEDSHSRALWGLGYTIKLANDEGMRMAAVELFDQAIVAATEFTSPRAWAFALVGVDDYLNRYRGDSEVQRTGQILANRLHRQFVDHTHEDWFWPEHTLTYSCGKLPHALLCSGDWLADDDMIDMGLRSLDWLLDLQTAPAGHLSLIGNRGWYPRDGQKAGFDQQPIEAHALLEACLEAHRITEDDQWFVRARRCFDWFLGRNDLGIAIYNYQTGGCRDGLHADGVNLNEGAESILAWLLSVCAMRSARLIESSRQSSEDLVTSHG
ncbi:glycosyltransferase family 4 protein [Rhodopirellula bahusiensis]|uniref:glycosyltransferase family 4 protein n=1 Tax=Rhodopirellula bahusiensis TaxID=2014065 RepID=UPI003263C6BE